jgi:hypothetical protein
VARALQLWPLLEATGLQLGSPAPTSSTTGTNWLASFMAGVKSKGLRVNWIDLHWYGNCTNPQNLITYLNTMENTYKLPIWLTEFACVNDTAAQNAAFFTSVAPSLEKLSYLQRYAWFDNRPFANVPGYQDVNLVTSTGALTAVGSAYVAVPAN